MVASDAYHHGDLRRTLVRIARDLVRESGPEVWSLREASRRAGVSQAAPYRHFPDKTALIDAVAGEAYAELAQRYREAVRPDHRVDNEAMAMARAYLGFALDEPRLFRLIFSSPRLHRTSEAVQSYGLFLDAVKRTQGVGALPPGRADDLAHMIWAAVHGVTDLVLSGSFGRRHGKAVAERLLEALFRGLGASDPRRL
jgi:AcrR family transcriptional regulator